MTVEQSSATGQHISVEGLSRIPEWMTAAYGDQALDKWRAIGELSRVKDYYAAKGNPYAQSPSVAQFVHTLASGETPEAMVRSLNGNGGGITESEFIGKLGLFLQGNGEGEVLVVMTQWVKGISTVSGMKIRVSVPDYGYSFHSLFKGLATQLGFFIKGDERYLSGIDEQQNTHRSSIEVEFPVNTPKKPPKKMERQVFPKRYL